MVELIYLFFGWCYFLCSDLNFKDINLGFGQKIYLFLMKLEVEVWRLRSRGGSFGNFGHPFGSFIRFYLWWKWLRIECFIIFNCVSGNEKIATTVRVSNLLGQLVLCGAAESPFPGHTAELLITRIKSVETRSQKMLWNRAFDFTL